MGNNILNALFSVIGPSAHVRSHVGPENHKLSMHLPLVVGKNGSRVRVADVVYPLVLNEPFIFDDTFDHEVWNDDPDEERVTLWMFLTHPDVLACGDGVRQTPQLRVGAS